MKKIGLFIVSLLLFFPVTVLAEEGISNYYIDATVLTNGDIHVKELFVLEGDYNGFERIINYKNSSAISFDGSENAFNGSNIYNGDSIELIKISSIKVDSDISFDTLENVESSFKEVSSANKGDFGVFTREVTTEGENYKIYNPSDENKKGFYVEYIISNMAVVHNDVAEIGFNIFSNQLNEDISHLEMLIHVPSNTSELRAWGHGPLYGETTNISSELIKLTIDDLCSNTAVDVRFVFEKSVVSNSTKFSNVDGLSKILSVEKIKADEANAIREEVRANIEEQKAFRNNINKVEIAWIIGLLILILYIYSKYDREYKGNFNIKYYREFPSEESPETIGYLLNKRIGNNEVSAALLNLMYKKVIDFQLIEKNNYLLKINRSSTNNLSESEKDLIDWIFQSADEIEMADLKREAKNNYEDFLSGYNSWKTSATLVAKGKNYFENNANRKILPVLYCLFGFLLIFIGINAYDASIYDGIVFFIGIVSLIYISLFTRRTVKGNEEYLKWNALKKFMLDFGNFKEKELPEVILWEKYLVYAVVLGCATKLSKSMEMKLKEITNGEIIDPVYDFNRIYFMTNFNHTMSNAIATSLTTAQSEKIAASSNSSAGGFGGGFSGGGGSFGGGGGGGRF